MSYNWEINQVATSYEGKHIPYGTGAGQIDCSHFVTQIISKATGTKFEYMQANNFEHSHHFRQVDLPENGDIVFWHKTPHGHVGIVVDAVQAKFIGSQSSHGVGTDHYSSSYWKSHGSGPKFLRYVG
jgi:cell wall-associated NlpC family hydrolase